MSTLTKIFIILLTLASLFLCGFIVQYVAFSENYKEQYTKANNKANGLESEKQSLTDELQSEKAKNQNLETSKASELASLNARISLLDASISKLNQDKTTLQGQVDKLQSENTTLATATKVQTGIADATSNQLKQTESNLTAEKKKYDEAAQALLQKDATIDQLQIARDRLLEEKVALEKKLTRYLQPYGQKPTPETPVTPEKGAAQPVVPTAPGGAAEIGLKAKVTAVDTGKNLAKISIGQADGVRLGMRFHVSRDGQYICDIRIIDVAAEEAIGSLELVQQQPQAGDNASTNL